MTGRHQKDHFIYKLPPQSVMLGLDSMGLSSFKFLWWAPKYASFLQQSAYRPFKVIQGRWFWHQRKGVCDFLWLIVTLVLSCTVLRYGELLAENCEFSLPHSLLTPSLGVNPVEFLDELFIPKTRLSVGEDFVILVCVIFTQCQRVTDVQTDRWTTRSYS